MKSQKYSSKYPLLLLLLLLGITLWSWIGRFGTDIWVLEAFPAVIAVALLLLTYKRFQFTNLVYTLIAVHCVILLIGAHYTYAEMPLFNYIKDAFDLARNHYDRVGHFAQGFIPAMVARELLIRTSPLRPGKWLFALIVMSCLGISAAYELLEWGVAEAIGESADVFLATQGDVWDTQKDMLLALIGAVSALLLLAPCHNKQLGKRVPSLRL